MGIEYQCVFLYFLIGLINCDIYLHNPRGSNNRLNEENRNRNNNNRVFDSQNNNRGGYNDGPLYYYTGSNLQIEWTNQHSCANPNSHCELVIQYMCHDQLRDGTKTQTIPYDQNQCENDNCDTDESFGMHENYESYLKCGMRSRNKGLFTADQDLFNNRRNSRRQWAINTRQNPNGNRNGYECPEERDYYPYWHPSAWKDIAIMTNDVKRCPFYQKESQNVKSRWVCVIPKDTLLANKNKFTIPNNKEDCDSFRFPYGDADGLRGVWTEMASHGLPAPDCRETEFTRDNHLGNGLHGKPNLYNWTVPNDIHENCAMRIRYNVSTNDYDPWTTGSESNAENKNDPSKVDISSKYGFATQGDAADRGYVFEDNPDVKIFGDADFDLGLAINTAQYGRTFQDRSFTFSIRKRPSQFEGKEIHNLNVRGKRGNIVEVYPSVEYDFVPNTVQMSVGDAVHVQWTGSNTNNGGNDGNGRVKTDRNNMLVLQDQLYPEGNNLQYGPRETQGHFGNNYPAHLSNTTLLGLSKTDRDKLAVLLPGRTDLSLTQLDDAGPYFDLEPRTISQTGTFFTVCTRNNDFSNRDQKGQILVYPYQMSFTTIGWMGGKVNSPNGKTSLVVPQGLFSQMQNIVLEEWTVEQGEAKLKEASADMPYGDEYVSDFLAVSPEEKLANERKITVDLKLNSDASDAKVVKGISTWDMGSNSG